MEYQIHILVHVYVGTDLSPCQLLSPLEEAKDYYWLFLCFLWEKLKTEKISMISGFQLRYSELSPLHLPGIKFELLGQKRSLTPPLSTIIWNCHTLLICKDLLWTDSSSFVNGGESGNTSDYFCPISEV